LYLADRDAGVVVRLQHGRLRLEHHRGMANIMADPQVTPDVVLVAAAPQPVAEETYDVLTALQDAPRLRLQAEVDQPAALLLQPGQVRRDRTQVGGGSRHPVPLGRRRAPSDRQ